MRTPISARRGYSLLDMLTVIIVLPVFMLLATKVYWTTMKTAHGTEEVMATQQAFDSAVRALRADAWGAERITAGESGTVELAMPGGAKVVWRTDGSGLLRVGADERRWKGLERMKMEVAARDDGTVVVRLRGRGGVDEVLLASQLPAGERRAS